MRTTNSGSQATGYTTAMAIAAGETVAQVLTLDRAGFAIDLTGATLKMRISLPSPLVLTTDNGGITVPGATLGIAQINIADTTSASLTTGVWPYDLWMIISGVATRLLSGTFTVLPSITPIP